MLLNTTESFRTTMKPRVPATAEATATARTGLFRFTFKAGSTPQIFIGDAGEVSPIASKILHASNNNTVINFTEAYTSKKQVKGGWIFSFAPATKSSNVIILKLSASQVGYESAQNNIGKEISALSFDMIRKQTHNEWVKKLAVIDVNDSNEQNKTVFYTALYHSLLIPWVVDDADGQYRGADGRVHQKTGVHQYGAFSPWDTFRSLHPLLSLLYPDKQKDIILSMLDIYKQTGHLPIESMTGNHAIPIIVDSYLKGVTGFDKQLAYTAMKKSVLEPPFVQSDMEIFNQKGYVPFTRSESVTRTVEYAYDDWALSQFAKNVIHNEKEYQLLESRGHNYRNLLNNDQLLFLPQNDGEFKLEPGMSGYKEGDKWVYSYFVPQNAKDLINLTGGNQQFTDRLDSVLNHNVILFDNETVFHLPYLFNQAGKPALTQKWLRQIMLRRFSNSPGGLPGNDDLGSTSSWYVFSAMGIYPVCPGRPVYAIGVPVFQSVILHLPNGKEFIVSSKGASAQNNYVQSLTVNSKPWQQLTLLHSQLSKGGQMTFTMGNRASNWPADKDPAVLSETKKSPDFEIINYTVSKHTAGPNELVTIYFSVANTGSTGIKIVKLRVNGKPYGYKNCMIASGSVKKDSMTFRLYPLGKTELKLDEMGPIVVEVIRPEKTPVVEFKITNLQAIPMIKLDEMQKVTYSIQNITGVAKIFSVPVLKNDSLLFTDTATLEPGEQKEIRHVLPAVAKGFQKISVGDEKVTYKVYNDNTEALLLDLSPVSSAADRVIRDNSGYQNYARVISADKSPTNSTTGKLKFDENTFVEVPNAASLDNMNETITVMGWVYPTGNEQGLVDIISKGDSHVLQVTDHKTLTFFAGGWGRGDCTVNLPADWNNKWHHIAGVCTGNKLYLYIDGILTGTANVEGTVNLSVKNKWTLGRNEEFPSERIYHGYINGVKIYETALTADDLQQLVKKERSGE
jgi:putative alpha-1,2-mannosidase